MASSARGSTPGPRWDLRLIPGAAGCWLGALAGLLGGLPGGVMIGATAVCCAAALLIGGRRAIAGVVAVLALVAAGATVAYLQRVSAAHDPLVSAADAGSWAVLEVRVREDPQPVAGRQFGDDQGSAEPATRWRISAEPVRAMVAGRAWTPVAAVTLFADGPQWQRLIPGELVRVGGLLGADDRSVLPAVVVRVRGDPELLADASWWQRGAAQLRQALVRSASGLDEDPRGLLPGLVVGDTSGIPEALSADAKATGLTHLLAVSGSHFAIVCGLVVLALRRLLGPRPAAVAGTVTLLGLVVLVGPEPSVLRAAVMGGVVMMGLLLRRGRAALPGLGVSVIVLLLLQPDLAATPGFALSVQATGGLLLLAPVWTTGLRRHGWPLGWAQLVVIPAAAGLVTMPVIASLSGSVSLAGLPANLLAAPVVAPALIIGLLVAVLGPWWPAGAHVLARADEPLLDWIAWVAHRLARWSAATVPWPASLPGVLALTGLAIAGLLALRHRRVRAMVVAASFGGLLVWVPAQVVPPGWPPEGWLMVACEVGQGDAMVLSTDEPGAAVVVDTGPEPALVDDCLDRLGVSTVPLLVLSHLHADHIGGLAGALEGRSVGAVLVGPDRSMPAWRQVVDLLAVRAIPLVQMSSGRTWQSAGLSMTALGPDKPFQGTDSDENNDSVALLAEHRGVRFLLPGDVELQAQRALLHSGLDLRADVLKQPHHGSAKFLPEFLAAVHPQVSLIGVGLGNDYGHPTRKALQLLSAAGVTVLRTDVDGDSAVCLIEGRLHTVARGAVLRSTKPAVNVPD